MAELLGCLADTVRVMKVCRLRAFWHKQVAIGCWVGDK